MFAKLNGVKISGLSQNVFLLKKRKQNSDEQVWTSFGTLQDADENPFDVYLPVSVIEKLTELTRDEPQFKTKAIDTIMDKVDDEVEFTANITIKEKQNRQDSASPYWISLNTITEN